MRINKGFLISIVTGLSLSMSAMAQDVWDSDGDGFDDNNDNCTLTHNLLQRDTDGDSFGNMCDADFNNDGTINFGDYNLIVNNFLGDNEHADLNGDGVVNFGDVFIFTELFLATPGPTGTNPEQPPCTCYFSGDCPTNTYCNYGPGSFSTEDICVWRDIKPFGVVGAGCSIESDLTTGNWTPDICDGVCASISEGSAIGLENIELVAQAMEIWGAAMINPSAAGGGPVDPALASKAGTLDFSLPDLPLQLGRYAADVLAMTAGEGFHDFYCHFEGHPEDPEQPVVDLSNNSCRVIAGQLGIQAFSSELRTPGTAAAIMQGIPEVCSDWQDMFATQCKPGPNALNCAIGYISGLSTFLRTPPAPATGPDHVMEMLGAQAR